MSTKPQLHLNGKHILQQKTTFERAVLCLGGGGGGSELLIQRLEAAAAGLMCVIVEAITAEMEIITTHLSTISPRSAAGFDKSCFPSFAFPP